MANILRRLAEISAAVVNFFRPSCPGLAEGQTECGTMEAEPAATASLAAEVNIDRAPEINAVAANFFRPSRPGLAEGQTKSGTVEAEPTATASLAAEVNVDSAPETNAVADFVPDQQEIERRRNLVRAFFNDFWVGVSDRPAAFVERLDRAEEYLNERLAANGELWRVDAKTRLMLGLPPHANARLC